MHHFIYIQDMSTYIHEKENWTDFYWNKDEVTPLVDKVRIYQGKLYGRLISLGFTSQLSKVSENLCMDIIRSSEIEGINLNMNEVRSSVATRLGIENDTKVAYSRGIEAVVNVMVDAMEHYDRPLTDEILWGWQSAFFEDRFSNGTRIEIGKYRTCEEQVVSGILGRENVHYEAPKPERIPQEMKKFLDWFNGYDYNSWVVRSAIAHFWFVSIHPFEDGNGRLARIVADMQLARGEESRLRFYNISSQINNDRKEYYRILELTQRGNGDITQWLVWFMKNLLLALKDAEDKLDLVMAKTNFWSRHIDASITERQRKILNIYLDGYSGKLNSKNWASFGKCSSDTANRDLQELCSKGLITCDDVNAKRRTYHIVKD